jgi:hypothetical protein
MSSPSLLEYHLISRRPCGGLLSKRLPISRYVPVCPTVRGLLRIVFLESFSLVEDLLRCLSSYRCSWSLLFPRQSCGTVSAIFVGHVLAVFQPETNFILPKVPLEGGGFKPINFGKWNGIGVMFAHRLSALLIYYCC